MLEPESLLKKAQLVLATIASLCTIATFLILLVTLA